MSKIQAAYDYELDVTDPRDSGFDGQPEETEPSEADNAVAELQHALSTLEQISTIGNYRELHACEGRLINIVQKTAIPF